MSLRKVLLVGGGVAVGAGLVCVGVPVAVVMLGFGATGIAGGSIAAWMMSLSAGATQAGGVVAICQSIGATGAVASSYGVLGGVAGGVAGYWKAGRKAANAQNKTEAILEEDAILEEHRNKGTSPK